jgi:hypothetical protein
VLHVGGIALMVAMVVDLLIWLAAGGVMWRHRTRLSRRQWMILGGGLAGMVALRVVVVAWL